MVGLEMVATGLQARFYELSDRFRAVALQPFGEGIAVAEAEV